MSSFSVLHVSHITERFLGTNENLNFSVERVEAEDDYVLLKATNFFSVMYCFVTKSKILITEWKKLQENLYVDNSTFANRYLVYIVPENCVDQSDLYEELARAERDDSYFRKVFIGLPEGNRNELIEEALSDRVPLWFARKSEVIKQYIPVLTDIIPDVELLALMKAETPSSVMKTIERSSRYNYLFKDDIMSRSSDEGVQRVPDRKEVGKRGSRITNLNVENFRGFKSRNFDLDGDIVIICGRNGTGKTTLCDALELSMFSKLKRLSNDPDLVKKNRPPLEPYIRIGTVGSRASITLNGETCGNPFKLRTVVSPNVTKRFLDGEEVNSIDIVKYLMSNNEPIQTGFLDLLLHTHFLGQHSIRDFIYGSRRDDQQKLSTIRYHLIAEMFGFGEVEQTKRRLSKILAQLKRAGISNVQKSIIDAKKKNTSLRRKYGPKCERDLIAKGIQIEMMYAVDLYNSFVAKVGSEVGSELIKTGFQLGAEPKEYLAACEELVKLVNYEIKTLEIHATEIKKIDQTIKRLHVAIPSVTLTEEKTISGYIDNLRDVINDNFKKTEELRAKLDDQNSIVKAKHKNLDVLKEFEGQQRRYIQLVDIESKITEELQIALDARQKHNTTLKKIKKRLRVAEMNEYEYMKAIQGIKHKIADYEALIAATSEVVDADFRISNYKNRLMELNSAIHIAEEQIQNEKYISAPLLNKTSDEDLLLGNGYFISRSKCPCCGSKFENSDSLRQAVAHRLRGGEMKRELLGFLLNIDKQYRENLSEAARDSIRIHQKERQAIENKIREIKEKLTQAEKIARDLGEDNVQDVESMRRRVSELHEEKSKLEDLLYNHTAVSLRKELHDLNKQTKIIERACNREELKTIKKEINSLSREPGEFLSESDLRDISIFKTKVARVEEDLQKRKLLQLELEAEYRTTKINEKKLRDIHSWIGIIESLIAKQESLGESTAKSVGSLSVSNLREQRKFYSFAKEAKDLIKIFGVLLTRERTKSLHDEVAFYEAERKKWEICHQNLTKINNEISKVSYAGISDSLKEYGPLINNIYRKFVRHDSFSDVILDFNIGRMARTGDLNMHLKTYSGEGEYTPASFLSEAQLNVLALSIFLTRVMYQNISALETVFIDDPIQQMDDMNVTAFIDVLLGLSQLGKQIILTTCSRDFYNLFSYKFAQAASQNGLVFKTIDLDEVDVFSCRP